MLKARQKIGKYRILKRIASGPQADVYKAFDTIHHVRVALKIPKIHDTALQRRDLGRREPLGQHEKAVPFKAGELVVAQDPHGASGLSRGC